MPNHLLQDCTTVPDGHLKDRLITPPLPDAQSECLITGWLWAGLLSGHGLCAVLVLVTSGELVLFKSMVDDLARYRFVVGLALIATNLAIALGVCVYQTLARAYKDHVSGNSEGMFTPRFNFTVTAVAVLGLLEGLAFFARVIPSALVPAPLAVTLLQAELPLDLMARRLGDSGLARLPTHRWAGAAVMLSAIGLQLAMWAGAASSEASKQQMFSCLLYAGGALPAVAARRWQARMLLEQPIDPWGLSVAKLTAQMGVGAVLILPLVKLQWVGVGGSFWPATGGTDS